MSRELEEILEEYTEQVSSFKHFRHSKELTKESLIEFQGRFVDLKAELRPISKKVAAKNEKRSDKQATAIKFRIAVAIHKGEFLDDKGELIYEKCTINQAEKYASASDKYREFLEERVFWKESYTNIRDLREDLNSYINLTKDLIKIIH